MDRRQSDHFIGDKQSKQPDTLGIKVDKNYGYDLLEPTDVNVGHSKTPTEKDYNKFLLSLYAPETTSANSAQY